MITGYSVIFVPSNDVEASKSWYENNLGLEWDRLKELGIVK